MSYPKDPKLNTLAHDVDAIKWGTQLNDEDADYALRLSLGQTPDQFEAVRKCTYLMSDSRTWAVRCYVGGAQRLVGVTRSCETAARFADAFQMHFWSYRIRNVKPPVDADLHFSAGQAKLDAKDSSAVQVLLAIEHHLQSIGALQSSEQLEQARYQDKRARSKRKSLRGDLFELNNQLLSALEVHAGRTEGSFDALRKELKRLNDRLDFMDGKQSVYTTSPDPTPGPTLMPATVLLGQTT